MFVRWKRRQLSERRDWVPPEFSLYAVLVVSHRNNCKPRQKIIRYLAHIKEGYLSETAHQKYFWERVDSHLSDLELDPTSRGEIELKISEKVKRPGEEEIIQLRKDQARSRTMW
jgi:hypothetical protein